MVGQGKLDPPFFRVFSESDFFVGLLVVPIISEYLLKVKVLVRIAGRDHDVSVDLIKVKLFSRISRDPVISEYFRKVKVFSRISAWGNRTSVHGSSYDLVILFAVWVKESAKIGYERSEKSRFNLNWR